MAGEVRLHIMFPEDTRLIDISQDRLRRLHDAVDLRLIKLYRYHGKRLKCRRGCSACCVDEITVFEVEAECIRRHHGLMLKSQEPHPEGACAFLDGGGECRIYPSRPYVCRSQGPPLRWIDERDDGSPVEMRDICPLNEPGPPIETLPPEACWTIGPVEVQLTAIQISVDGGRRRRVSLRSLFSRKAGSKRF
ncbi:MAG: YkgJ family cysteine cluster protein [Desulfobacterales bacterium]